MNSITEYTEAMELLLKLARTADEEKISLDKAAGRVLAKPLVALYNVPPFDRSPYDGYAFCSEDVSAASKDAPVTLNITEEIAAGSVERGFGFVNAAHAAIAATANTRIFFILSAFPC